MVLNELADQDIRNFEWYYSCELRPGVFTKGRHHQNVWVTRMLMSRIDFHGMRVLDIGAMEGYSTILARKAGATVTAYDRPTGFKHRVDLVKEAQKIDFEYVNGVPFNNYVWNHRKTMQSLFDCIIFSGVLYHTIEPLVFLWFVRSLLRHGGIMILETQSVLDNEPYLLANAHGRYIPANNYYFPSTGWLDYYVRALGLRPIDIEYIHLGETRGRKMLRTGLTCILELEDATREPDDTWTGRKMILEELAEYLEPVTAPSFPGVERVSPATYDRELYYSNVVPVCLRLTDTIKSKPALPEQPVLLKLEDSLYQS
jgi:2-polyprenyl-3-methyl-5-hydroxy-6-metoxy-1,4-benzoquinol methylase